MAAKLGELWKGCAAAGGQRGLPALGLRACGCWTSARQAACAPHAFNCQPTTHLPIRRRLSADDKAPYEVCGRWGMGMSWGSPVAAAQCRPLDSRLPAACLCYDRPSALPTCPTPPSTAGAGGGGQGAVPHGGGGRGVGPLGAQAQEGQARQSAGLLAGDATLWEVVVLRLMLQRRSTAWRPERWPPTLSLRPHHPCNAPRLQPCHPADRLPAVRGRQYAGHQGGPPQGALGCGCLPGWLMRVAGCLAAGDHRPRCCQHPPAPALSPTRPPALEQESFGGLNKL